MSNKNNPIERIFTLADFDTLVTFNPTSTSTQKHYNVVVSDLFTVENVNGGICAEIVTKFVKYGIINPFRTASGIVDVTDRNIEIKSSEFQIAEQFSDCKTLNQYLEKYFSATPRTHFDIALFNNDFTALHVWHFNKTQFKFFCRNYGKHGKGAVRFDGKKARGRKLTIKGMREYISKFYG